MIEIRGLTVAFGAVVAIDALDAVLHAPVCGLIGPNGAGKTTLVNLLSGFVQAKAGEVRVDETALLGMNTARRARFGLRRSFQTEQVVEDLSVWDNVQSMLDHVPHPRDRADAQLHRALEHAGKVEQGVRFERVLVLLERDREDPPHATRHDRVEIAAERADRLVYRRRNLRGRGTVPLPRIGRVAILGTEAGAHEFVAARFAVLREEIGAQAIDQMSKGRLFFAALKGPRYI